jgi:phosphate:Na+ symporter
MSGVCLMLWGMRSLTAGMTRAFGAELHKFIAKCTSNKISAFLSGIGVTALLQSSTATALIIAGFCDRGLMTISSGMTVMLGANVGTALVAQALSFDLSWLMPLLMTGGFIMFKMFEKKGKLGHVGRMMIGLGIMLLALYWIRDSSAPLQNSEILPVVLKSFDADPIFAVIIATILTWICHSSLAVVLLMVSLVSGGVLPAHLGLAMVLGANIGGAIPPLLAGMKDSPQAARVPLGNLITRFIGVVLILPFLSPILAYLHHFIFNNDHRILVNFHVILNVALAVVFMPFSGMLARLTTRLVPDKPSVDDPGKARYLDVKELTTPVLALSSAARETLRMADIVQNMLEDTIIALRTNDESLVYRIRNRDDVLDNLYKQIKMYMAKMMRGSLDPSESKQYVQILGFSTNLESVGDTIDKSLMEMALVKIRSHKRFSHQGWEEILDIHNLVMETIRLAQSVFVSNDPKLARRLLESKDRLRLAEVRGTESHMQRIREGVPETIESSSLHLDILRDYRRINSYMATVAYPILEDAGQLTGSRLKPVAEA